MDLRPIPFLAVFDLVRPPSLQPISIEFMLPRLPPKGLLLFLAGPVIKLCIWEMLRGLLLALEVTIGFFASKSPERISGF